MARRGKLESIVGKMDARNIEGVDKNFSEIFDQLDGSLEIPEDSTDGDLLSYDEDTDSWVPLSQLGVSYFNSGTSASSSTFLRGDGTWAAPVSGGDWDTTVVKSADQGVTNSAVLVNATEMTITVTAGSIWRIQIYPIFTATTAVPDFSFSFNVSSGTMNGVVQSLGLNTTLGLQDLSEVLNGAAAPFTRSWGADTTNRTGQVELFCTFSAAATFQLQFCQAVATAATTTTLKAGSLLRGERIL